jgi:hypothetical protein
LEIFGAEEIPDETTKWVVVVHQQDSGGGVDVFHLAPLSAALGHQRMNVGTNSQDRASIVRFTRSTEAGMLVLGTYQLIGHRGSGRPPTLPHDATYGSGIRRFENGHVGIGQLVINISTVGGCLEGERPEISQEKVAA